MDWDKIRASRLDAMLDFLKQLTTFRVTGPALSDRISAVTRFGRLFLGKLWDVYATGILTTGPI